MHHPIDIEEGRVRDALITFFVGVFAFAHSAADEVIIDNGDRLTGRVVRTDQSTLRLETDYAGTLSINWSKVHSVRFDEPRKVLLDDETEGRVKEFSQSADQVIVQKYTPSESISVAPSRVRVIEPEPWETDEGARLSGRVNLALKSEKGNTDKNEIDFDFMLDYRRRWHRIESFGILEYDTESGEKTTDKWSLNFKYSRLYRGPWYAAGFVLAGHDRFADKRLRVGVAPTLGYRVYEGPERNLRTELGGGYVTEDFYAQPDRDYWGPFWYLDYDQLVWQDQLQLYHTHRAFWAVDDTTKQLWRSWTGVRVPLVSGFVGSIEYEIEYDSDPAVEAKDTDTTLRLKLGYQW